MDSGLSSTPIAHGKFASVMDLLLVLLFNYQKVGTCIAHGPWSTGRYLNIPGVGYWLGRALRKLVVLQHGFATEEGYRYNDNMCYNA